MFKIFFIFFMGFSLNSWAGDFFLAIPLGLQTVKSLEVNGALVSEGIESITDLSTSNYTGGIGYEWDSGFRLAFRGGQVSAVDEFSGSVFANYTIMKGGIGLEYPLFAGAMHRLDLGGTLGGSVSRFTLIGSALSGVAQKIDGFFEPSLSYKYGAKSVKFFTEVSYPVLIEGEFKSFGTPGVNSLSGPGISVVLGVLLYL
jgi:hypothetical protein